jgi:hypothetical protein
MAGSKNIEYSLSIERLLVFEEIFPEEQPLTPQQYLAGGSRDFILNVGALFLGFKPNHSKFDDILELLKMFFSVENDDFVLKIYDKVYPIQNEGTDVKIINTYSVLTPYKLD